VGKYKFMIKSVYPKGKWDRKEENLRSWMEEVVFVSWAGPWKSLLICC